MQILGKLVAAQISMSDCILCTCNQAVLTGGAVFCMFACTLVSLCA